MSKTKILLADGDAPRLLLLAVALRRTSYDVATATSLAEAREHAMRVAPDLVITSDVLSDDEDGFALVNSLRGMAQTAQVPVLVLAPARASLVQRIADAGPGVAAHIGTPASLREVLGRVAAALDTRAADPALEAASSATPMSGTLGAVGLLEIVQGLIVDRASGRLVLRSASGRGTIGLQDGVVVDARSGPLFGEGAFHRMFLWDEGTFTLRASDDAHMTLEPAPVDGDVEAEGAIRSPTDSLLVEAARRMDAWDQLRAQLPPLEHTFVVDDAELVRRRAHIPERINAVLQLFHDRRTLLDVVGKAQVGDVEALEIARTLLAQGLIVDVTKRAPSFIEASDAGPPSQMEDWLLDTTAAASAAASDLEALLRDIPTLAPRPAAHDAAPGSSARQAGAERESGRRAGEDGEAPELSTASSPVPASARTGRVLPSASRVSWASVADGLSDLRSALPKTALPHPAPKPDPEPRPLTTTTTTTTPSPAESPANPTVESAPTPQTTTATTACAPEPAAPIAPAPHEAEARALLTTSQQAELPAARISANDTIIEPASALDPRDEPVASPSHGDTLPESPATSLIPVVGEPTRGPSPATLTPLPALTPVPRRQGQQSVAPSTPTDASVEAAPTPSTTRTSQVTAASSAPPRQTRVATGTRAGGSRAPRPSRAGRRVFGLPLPHALALFGVTFLLVSATMFAVKRMRPAAVSDVPTQPTQPTQPAQTVRPTERAGNPAPPPAPAPADVVVEPLPPAPAPALAPAQAPAPVDPQEAGYSKQMSTADALARRGEFGKAVRSYEAALLLRPDSAAAHLALGNAYYEVDAIDAALTHLERARDLTPDDPQVYALLGAAYQSSGARDDAVSAYRRYLTLAPEGRFARDIQGLLRGMGAR